MNLIGEHTDYNDGFVFPMATETGLVFTARPRSDRKIRVASRMMGDALDLALDEPIGMGPPAWGAYVRGVLAGLTEGGVVLPGFDALISGNLPLGSGLSSSAALEVGMATLGEALADVELDPLEKALLCQHAEHTFAGVPCGIMDQFAVVFSRPGHLLLLDCRTLHRELVALAGDDVRILIINSMVRHELSSGAYAIRRGQCNEAARLLGVGSLRDATIEQVERAGASGRLSDVLHRRARHVTTENARTLAAAEAVRDGRWSELGLLLYDSHESLRRDYEVSCAELDTIVQIARELGEANGVHGCRMTGGGFGGCAVALVRGDRIEQVEAMFRTLYQRRTGIDAEIMATRPAGGAEIVRRV